MMKKNWIRAIGAGLLVAIWLGLTGFMWFGARQETSDAERRPLAQAPEMNLESILDGSFMTDFEDFTLDQFPLRDSFRQFKSLFHYYALQQMDNNDIYIADGYAAKLEYPMNENSVTLATSRFNTIYERFLKDSGCKTYLTVVPDKSYYLAEEKGYLSLDYKAFYESVYDRMPWATPVDVTDCLDITDYYYTDTHWRQEKLFAAADKICQAMGVTGPEQSDYSPVALDRPFYGVYYGQAALPMDPETIYILKNEMLDSCTTSLGELDAKTGELSYRQLYNSVYDMSKADAKDMYEVYLSGSQSLLRIDNPNGKEDRELIVFRDSFGSSMTPLLVQDYKMVTIVDIRYISSSMLNRFITFDGQDVLFMYSTSVLNSTGSSLLP